MRVLVTGWAGFIGSNLTRHLLEDTKTEVIGLDAHTYAARPGFVTDNLDRHQKKHFHQMRIDLRNSTDTRLAVLDAKPDHIIHLAAESHVCRSFESPGKFFDTNVMGTYNLLEAARDCWKKEMRHIFHHVSTDEVYGSLELQEPKFREDLPYQPRSPYAASKAASDHLVMSYHHSFGLNTRITNCSNNFGPNQHEEKLVPKAILSILAGEPMTLYQSGLQIRDWLWVGDHCKAILKVMERGEPGERYLIGGENEMTNREMVEELHRQIEKLYGPHPLKIVKTNDRPTDDYRYAIDTTKIREEIGFSPMRLGFKDALRATIKHYKERFDGNRSGAV